MASYTRATPLSATPEKSVPFGKYSLTSPLVISFVPRSQGCRGSAK